jgi:hypothetical protein
MKDNNNTSIPLNVENAFFNTQNPFMEKALNKLGIERLYVNMIKLIYDKPQLTLYSMVKN